jgi:3-hydroxyacyl-CoA dehydrogenase/enoyl-CoA hydratase/3-hydroxybutyryl-CoA epimerase/3-hydroxyacyl-CoA dehydrogenase/enoyl-CoA hydratase/3-hydroxybutyryl-CoA epimerase/enoyl-CoA isomerase
MSAIELRFPEPDVAHLVLDAPEKSVNVLSQAVRAELGEHLAALAGRSDLTGLVLGSAKTSGFAAGADIREFVASQEHGYPRHDVVAMCRRVQELYRQLSTLPFPTVAAVQGVCLGGGAELASWCDVRVLASDDRTQFGCPEIKLGLIPGWGGTVRLPRMIGLANAMELICKGEPVDGQRAKALGIACDVVPPEQLLSASIAAVRAWRRDERYLRERERLSRPVSMSDTEVTFLGATASAAIQKETQGQYPAPVAALSLMLESSRTSVDEALASEAEAFADLFGSPVNKALVNVFFLTDRAKKPPLGVPPAAAPLASAGVIGAGIMGAGIAAAQLKRGLATTLIDANPAALEAGTRNVLDEVAYDKSQGKADPEKALRLGLKLHTSGTLSSIAGCEIVVEAIAENLEAKHALYRELEPLVSPSAVIASNTSTLPIHRLATALAHSQRLCGIHFFNPVRRMKLVEIIRGVQTSTETLSTAASFARQIGKFAIVVKDGPGFLVNRLLSPYLNSALELLHEGASVQAIDRAAVQFGMPLGPLALYDLVGLDTAFAAGRTMYEAFPDRFIASPILPALMKAGRLGRKNGLGFYRYAGRDQRPERDPAAETILATYVKADRGLSSEQITLRLFLPMLLEATRVLEEGVVSDPRDVDIGLIYGLGFPAFKGGLLYWADQVGVASLSAMRSDLQSSSRSLTLTKRFEAMAASQETFYRRSA